MRLESPFRMCGKEYSEELLNGLGTYGLKAILSFAKDELLDVETFLDIDDGRDPEKTKKRRVFRRLLESFIELLNNKINSKSSFESAFYFSAMDYLDPEVFDEISELAKEAIDENSERERFSKRVDQRVY